MAAVALLAGVSGNAWANGTEMPPESAPYSAPPQAPAREYKPAPVKPVVMNKNTGPYVSAAAGIGFPSLEWYGYDVEDALDSGLVLNGAVGYNFGSARLEAAVGYQSHDLSDFDDVNVSVLTGMANAYYDFDIDSSVRPYIMGGAGIASVDTNQDTDSETVFAWQVGAGLGFKIARNTTLDLGYRYLKPNKIEDSLEIESHNVMLGLRFQF